MKFPNAHAGVKKLFICELIAVLAAVLAIVGAALAAFGLKNAGLIAVGGSVVLASGIALLVVFIIQLVGLHQAGKDEIQIRYAFYLTILSLVIGLATSILGSLKTESSALDLVKTILSSTESVATLLASYFVLMGISSLSGKLNDKAMEAQGRRLAYWVIIFFVISIAFKLVGVILKGNTTSWIATLAAILAIIASVAELVVYIITFIYYGKAVKMLEK